MMEQRGVIFDWRGTLVVTPSDLEWCHLALARLGRPADVGSAQQLLAQIEAAPSVERLSAHGVDTAQPFTTTPTSPSSLTPGWTPISPKPSTHWSRMPR